MAYKHDDEARSEASRLKIGDDEIADLRDLCGRKTADLGPPGVRAHWVGFPATAWGDAARCLPGAVLRQERVSRGDVFEIASQVRDSDRCAADLLTASFIWGMGRTGYGPRRYRDICAMAGGRLEQKLRQALEAGNDSDYPDPVAGYAQLYGGDDDRQRAAPQDERWSRLHGYGPAFFTKFLYFSTPGALILDARMARAVLKLSGTSHLISADGSVPAWTPYRYCVYLHWTSQTAQTVGVTPDLLEATLFRPPPDPPGEDEAAD